MIFGRGPKSADAAVLERLKALETRCQSLSDALEARDVQVEKLRLDQLVLGRRLDEAQVQSGKAVTGLFDRLEALRTRVQTTGLKDSTTALEPHGSSAPLATSQAEVLADRNSANSRGLDGS